MKGKIITLFFILSFVLFTGISYAGPYSLECHVGTDDQYVDTDLHHAYYQFSNGEGEARADTWDIGAKINATIDSEHTGAVYWSDAWFSQEFVVTGQGPASITFAWDGNMSISPSYTPDSGWNDIALAETEFSLTMFDSKNHSWGDDATLHLGDDPSSQNYSGTYTFEYDFSQEDVGTTFDVGGYLWTGVYGWLGSNGYSGSISIDSNFYDSLKITDVSGGIAAVVPIPGALWLLVSGLICLIAVRHTTYTMIKA